MYTYIVEDGQFSSEHFLPSLLGDEGDTVTIYEDDHGTDIFIALIQEKTVYCIGCIDREFPSSIEEFNNLRNYYLETYSPSKRYTYQFTYYNEKDEVSDDPIFIEANSEEEAMILFKEDYPKLRIYQCSIDW